jgi:hypothetical protein
VTCRVRLDDMTDDQLDALYARLEAAERLAAAVHDLEARWAGHVTLTSRRQVAAILAGIRRTAGWVPLPPDPGPPGWPELTTVTTEEMTR